MSTLRSKSRIALSFVVAAGLGGLMAFTSTGCASTATASNTAITNMTPAEQLAAASNATTDRAEEYAPDVSNSSTITRTIYLDGNTASEQKPDSSSNASSTDATTESTSADADSDDSSSSDSNSGGSVAYTATISIDPYAQLWKATGIITGVNTKNDTISVRLSSYETGHFQSTDVLISYANDQTVSERSLQSGATITFQYLLTDPMRSPLQAHNISVSA